MTLLSVTSDLSRGAAAGVGQRGAVRLPLLVLVQCLTAADFSLGSRALASKYAAGSASPLRAGAGIAGCVARHGGLCFAKELSSGVVEGPEPPGEQDGSAQRFCAECEVDLEGRSWYMGFGKAHCSEECVDAARRRQPAPPSRS